MLQPLPRPQRVIYLEHKYSSLALGRSDRGQGDILERCRTHFQPEEGRDGGGGVGRRGEPGSDALRPIENQLTPPMSHHTSAFSASTKASERVPSKTFKRHYGHDKSSLQGPSPQHLLWGGLKHLPFQDEGWTREQGAPRPAQHPLRQPREAMKGCGQRLPTPPGTPSCASEF